MATIEETLMPGPSRNREAAHAFAQRIRVASDDALVGAGKALRGIASDIAEALIVGSEDGPGTPVDTGWARGNWFAELGESQSNGHPALPALVPRENKDGTPGQTMVPAASPETLAGAALNQMTLVVAGLKPGDVLSYINNAAYIESLNNGSSAQAPAGITDAVVVNFPRIVERNVAKFSASGVTMDTSDTQEL